MKNIFKIALMVIVVAIAGLGLMGCPGPIGDIYLKHTWSYTPVSFADDNPGTPSTIYYNTYYKIDAGTYNIWYTDYSWNYWHVQYTVTANPGKPYGIAGDDKYFEIYFTYGSGAYFYGPYSYAKSVNAPTRELATPISSTMDGSKSVNKSDGVFVSHQHLDLGNYSVDADLFRIK
jgi:hypothetical protein